jgi:PAS domain S-box-containing protein
MMDQTRLLRCVAIAAVPATTAALATMIFVAQATTSEKLTAALFYVLVVLLAARFCSAWGVVLVGAGCVGLTLLAFFLPGLTETNAGNFGLKASVSAAVIGLTTLLVIEHHRATDALRASEERWRRLFETSSAGMALFRLDGVCTAANPALQRMLGFSEDEIVGHNVLELNHPDERAATAEALERYRAGTLTERNVEKKYVKKDGTPVWLNITNTLVPATETAAPSLQAVYVDVTTQLQAEAALRASEERWRAVFETATVGLATEPLDGGPTNRNPGNPAFQRLLGYSESELRRLTVYDFTHEDDVEETRKLHDAVVTGRQPSYRLEKRYRRKDGTIVWADASVSMVPAMESTPAFLAIMVIDITERKRAEAALRASEERWRTVYETAAVGIVTLDLDLRYLTANTAFQRMTGYIEDELRDLTAHRIAHEDDRVTTQEVIDDVSAIPQRSRRRETRYRRKDGEIIWADVNSSLIPGTDGTPVFLASMAVDITERKRAETALRASEERWRAMVETAPVGIATLDFEHKRYLTANESFQRVTGYTEDELRQLTAFDITHEDNRAATQQRIESGAMGVLQRKRYRRKDGEIIWAEVTAFVVPATDSTPAFLGAVIVDITERKRAEEALQQAQADLAQLNRVMLLGEMTASIAHEINQPIAAVITNANAGLRWLGERQPDLSEIQGALSRIVRDGMRAGEVIGRIRALVRKLPPRRDLFEINEVIREVVSLTQGEMQRHGVGLQSPLADDLPLISADRVQLQQVMINLIVNAIEAMDTSERPRELTIASGKGEANDVFVEVRDTGPGLDPEKLDVLFQSFYTTKPDGIGMGLAISRSIAEAHGGRLSAAPNKPHGAVFHLTLPVEETSSPNLEQSRS